MEGERERWMEEETGGGGERDEGCERDGKMSKTGGALNWVVTVNSGNTHLTLAAGQVPPPPKSLTHHG